MLLSSRKFKKSLNITICLTVQQCVKGTSKFVGKLNLKAYFAAKKVRNPCMSGLQKLHGKYVMKRCVDFKSFSTILFFFFTYLRSTEKSSTFRPLLSTWLQCDWTRLKPAGWHSLCHIPGPSTTCLLPPQSLLAAQMLFPKINFLLIVF